MRCEVCQNKIPDILDGFNKSVIKQAESLRRRFRQSLELIVTIQLKDCKSKLRLSYDFSNKFVELCIFELINIKHPVIKILANDLSYVDSEDLLKLPEVKKESNRLKKQVSDIEKECMKFIEEHQLNEDMFFDWLCS